MARLALVNPPPNDNRDFIIEAVTFDNKFPPGLCYVDAYVEAHKHESHIIDAYALGLDSADIVKHLASHPVDVLGINMLSPTEDIVSIIASKVRQAFPNIIVLVGGPHPSLQPAETLKAHSAIDIAVSGEGEATTKEFLGAVDSYGAGVLSQPAILQTINGISYRYNGDILSTPARSRFRDLDTLPFPSYHKLPLDRYWQLDKTVTMVTSRGCPYKCSFCATGVLWKNRVSYRSIPNVLAEIEHWHQSYDVNNFYFTDMNFSVKRHRLRAFCEGVLNSGLSVNWKCLTRIDCLDEDTVRLMARAGCKIIAAGIESGNPVIQQAINKNLDLDRVEHMTSVTADSGIHLEGFFIIGFPQEGPSQIYDTVNYIIKLRHLGMQDYRLFIATPYLGTELFDTCQNLGFDPVASEVLEDGNIYASTDPAAMQRFRRVSYVPQTRTNPYITPEGLRRITHAVHQKFKSGSFFTREEIEQHCSVGASTLAG